MNEAELKKRVSHANHLIKQVYSEMGKVVIGQKTILDGFIRGLIANGHILAEGVPGIGKTLIVRVLSIIFGCEFGRVQFTPDLLPSDIIGITTYIEGEGFQTYKGPIFANFVLADEINRAPPKVQSALLEAMQEKQATIGHNTYPLPHPFIVMATQNPLETLGTYPLPEAQIDRFLFKLNVVYPTPKEEIQILDSNITLNKLESYEVKTIFDIDKVLEMQEIVKDIFLNNRVKEYIVRIIEATRNPLKYKLSCAKYVDWGASPRASIGIFIASKAEAILRNSTFVKPDYVKKVVPDVLRHRIILNYLAQAEGVTEEDVISEILKKVRIP